MWPDVCWTWVGGRESWKGSHLLPFPLRTTWKVVRGGKGPLTRSIGAAS